MAHPEQPKVIQEVFPWLRIFDDGSVDRTWLGPPEFKFMSDPAPTHEHFIDGIATRDVTVDSNSGLRVRLYLPETKKPGSEPDPTTNKLPIIVHFHGGGFCITQADWFMYYAVCTYLARSAKAIIVSVYLRLAPENPLPAAIDDGLSTLHWLTSIAQAKSHDPWLTPTVVDFTRVFLIGDSSGGNLVHLVAAKAASTTSLMKLAGVIPIHPGFCRAERSRSELEMPETPFLTLDMADKFIALALPPGSTKDHPFTCPMGPEAPPLEEVKLPPVMLCVAEKDLIIDTEMEYFNAMKKAGKVIELFVSNGMTHSFYLNRVAVESDPVTKGENERLFDAIANFIERH